MPNATFDELAKAIRKALNEIHAQQRANEAERRTLEGREQMLNETLHGLTENGNGRKRTQRRQPSEPAPIKVADKHLKAVREFVAARSEGARQADMGEGIKDPDTGRKLNSGTVSLALRKLEQEGLVERRPKLHGSRVWAEATNVHRSTVVTPGEGVEEGRLVKS